MDLRYNKISEEVLRQDLIPALKHNNSLTNLDSRYNSGYTPKLNQLMALCLLKNVDKLKKSSV
jgi:hypothetical protein